jgi:hypothetical protein
VSTETVKLAPREITDEEVAFFRENGWVKFDKLVSDEVAAVLLARLQELMGEDAHVHEHPAHKGDPGAFNTFAPLGVDRSTGEKREDVFYEFSHSAGIGRLGAKLAGKPVRYWVDQALVKRPSGWTGGGAGATPWHADVGAWDTSPFDPAHGQMQLWIALKPVPPARGSMRFVSPKNVDEEFLRIVEESEKDPARTYDALERKGILSPPLDIETGDATIHASATWHSAPVNTTDEPRWVYIVSMFPADARYSGKPFWPMEGVAGVEQGQAFPDHRFPVLA